MVIYTTNEGTNNLSKGKIIENKNITFSILDFRSYSSTIVINISSLEEINNQNNQIKLNLVQSIAEIRKIS